MFAIPILILLALLFLVAELVLLPGLTISGILALACGGGAVYMAFTQYGAVVGWIVVALLLLLSLLAVVISLRSTTWQYFALKQEVKSAASEPIEARVAVGSRGKCLSRLSPMGSVEIEGKIYEAKLLSGYADAHSEVEVVGYENSNIIVKIVQ